MSHSKPLLLDVNLLLALAWPSHVHHRVAHAWFKGRQKQGWATCPLTQCAFVRISSNPAFTPDAVSPQQALQLLRRITGLPHHQFWPDDLDFAGSDFPATGLLAAHRQVTDTYLLGLAIRKSGCLATLDAGVSALLPADDPGTAHLEIIDPSQYGEEI